MEVFFGNWMFALALILLLFRIPVWFFLYGEWSWKQWGCVFKGNVSSMLCLQLYQTSPHPPCLYTGWRVGTNTLLIWLDSKILASLWRDILSFMNNKTWLWKTCVFYLTLDHKQKIIFLGNLLKQSSNRTVWLASGHSYVIF